jgi:tRNA A-37 threonylcarbamoyl transferase component Bud32
MKNTYNLREGDVLAGKYRVVGFLGSGWEGEVFKIKEIGTDIERAAKLFHPKRNIRGKAAQAYAKKLHKLRNCPMIIQYHTVERVELLEEEVSLFISEYVDGVLLTEYLKRFRGRIIPSYQGLHLLHALTMGIESIHHMSEYHGDLHADNILVERFGLQPEIKLLDFFNHGRPDRSKMQNDIIDLIKIFYDAIGGQRTYSKQNELVHEICCGLKHGLIRRKFPTASDLRWFLEAEEWF